MEIFSRIIVLLFLATVVTAAPRSRNDDDLDKEEYHPQPSKFDYVDFPGEKIDWFQKAQERLTDSLARDPNMNKAKNVILFVGDGMGVSTVTAARIYNAQTHGLSWEDSYLAWENLPQMALSITNNVDYQVPDSAGTATAMLSGVKNNYYTVGVTEEVKFQNCTLVKENKLRSALKYAMDAGKRTGIVTTTRITHATPAAAYSSSPDRGWEGYVEDDKAINGELCTDIAQQLVDDEEQENQNINVILGGGRKHFLPNDEPDLEPDDFPEQNGTRTDGRNLINEWLKRKEDSGLDPEKFEFVKNKEEFDEVKPNEIEHLLVEDVEVFTGLFNPDHLDFEIDRIKRDEIREPSLADMVRTAIQILERKDEGFFLLVEGGRIDHAHHDNNAHRSLNETVMMSQALEVALDMTDKDETLIVVTADHSHVFTMGGYNSINNDILGFSDDSYGASDGKPFTTLSYANGPGFYDHRHEDGDSNKKEIPRKNLTGVDTTDPDYLQDATIPMLFESHGGEEVAIYASGPMSHLFNGVVQQNYIAHVMMYAACIGRNKDHCEKPVRYPLCPTTDAAPPRFKCLALVSFLALAQFFTRVCTTY